MSKEDGQAAFDAVVAEATDFMAKRWVPGLVIGVIHGDNSYTTGIGVTNVDTKEPVKSDTLFHICSVSKTFCAMLAVQMSEQGDLDLNARMVDLLPWFKVNDPEATSKAKVIDLFHHHAGWSGDHCFLPVPPGGSNSEKCMLQACYLPQIVPFGQTWMYNNTSLAFAGHVLSVTGGKPYETLIEERFISPLGMDSTTFDYGTTPPPPGSNYAWGHPPIYAEEKIAELKPIFTPFPPTAGCAGGLVSHVHDMLKWARFQLDGKDKSGNTLISKESRDFAYAPAVEAPTGEFQGVTWFVRKYPGGVTSASHPGTYVGYRAFMQVIPEHNFGIVMMCNSDRGVEVYEHVANEMIKAFTKLEPTTAVAAGVDPAVLDPFVGLYKGNWQDFQITKDGDNYFLTQRSIELLTKPGVAPAPAKLETTGEGWFIVMEGPNKGMLGELLEDSSGERNYLRFSHRIFIRAK